MAATIVMQQTSLPPIVLLPAEERRVKPADGELQKTGKLSREQLRAGVVACSAGNHAQGVALSAVLLASGPPAARRATAVGPPKEGLFDDCTNACVSSQDDRPAVWDNPWIAEQEPSAAMKRLRTVVEKKLQGRVVEEDERRRG